MGLSTFPVASTSSSSGGGLLATSTIATTTNTLYTTTMSFSPGTYNISLTPATSVANLQFMNNNTYISTVTTTSGATSTSYLLTTSATRLEFWVTGNNNTTIAITQANSITANSGISGTVTNYTSSTNYNQVSTNGLGYVVVIGGGGGGGDGCCGGGGGGGGGGGLASGALTFDGTIYPIEIGAGGFTGGTSRFGNVYAYGGGQGQSSNTAQGGSGGSPGGGRGSGPGTASASTASIYPWVTTAVTGGGPSYNRSGAGNISRGQGGYGGGNNNWYTYSGGSAGQPGTVYVFKP